MGRIIAIGIVAILSNLSVIAQVPFSEGKKHIIIAFDEAGNSWRRHDPQVRNFVGEMLFANADKVLFSNDDYFSVVGFKADCSGKEWNNFVYIKRNPNNESQKLAFVKDSVLMQSMLNNPYTWSTLARYGGGFIDTSYSLLSIAKPYILSKIGAEKNKPLVNKTYIVLITDHQFNGGDFHNELQYFLSQGLCKTNSIYSVLNLCYNVGEEYTFKYIDSRKWGIAPLNRYVELFEVCPNQEYLTLPAVIDYSPSIKAERKKGKQHSFCLELKKANQHFDVKRLNIYLQNPLTHKERFVETVSDLDSFSRNYTIRKDEGLTENGVTLLKLEAELVIKDGFYDCTLLNKNMVPGLAQTIVITNEENAKLLFGLADLPDWLWRVVGVSNQQRAAVIISFLLLAIAIGIFVAYVMLMKEYKPKKEDVSIKYYD